MDLDEELPCDISGRCVAPKGAHKITNCIFCGKELVEKNGEAGPLAQEMIVKRLLERD